MTSKAKAKVWSSDKVSRNGKGRGTIKTVISEGKGKMPSVETKGKRQSSKGQEASSESSDEEGQDHSSENESSFTPTVPASTTTNALDIEDVRVLSKWLPYSSS